MKTRASLSVVDRVRAALRVKRMSGTAVPITVSEICRIAKVNRANLYAAHRDLVEEIRQSGTRVVAIRTAKEKAHPLGKDRSESEMASLIQQNRALLLVCLEQQLEIKSLRARLQR